MPNVTRSSAAKTTVSQIEAWKPAMNDEGMPETTIISVMDVINVGQQIIEANSQQYPSGVFWIYGFIFMLYFIVDYPLSLISRMLQQKFSANL